VSPFEFSVINKKYGPSLKMKHDGLGATLLRYNERLEAKERIEITVATITQTNWEILVYAELEDLDMVETPLGKARLADENIIKLMGLSCVEFLNKYKHREDLKLLDGVTLPQSLAFLLTARTLETKARVAKQKSKFFNRYEVPRFMEHDSIHKHITKYFNKNAPAYELIVSNPLISEDGYTPHEGMFNMLLEEDKFQVCLEEVLALCLERWVNKRYAQGMNFLTLRDRFSRVKKSTDPLFHTLDRLSEEGLVKDHPSFLCKYIQENRPLLRETLREIALPLINSLPNSYWAEIRDPEEVEEDELDDDNDDSSEDSYDEDWSSSSEGEW